MSQRKSWSFSPSQRWLSKIVTPKQIKGFQFMILSSTRRYMMCPSLRSKLSDGWRQVFSKFRMVIFTLAITSLRSGMIWFRQLIIISITKSRYLMTMIIYCKSSKEHKLKVKRLWFLSGATGLRIWLPTSTSFPRNCCFSCLILTKEGFIWIGEKWIQITFTPPFQPYIKKKGNIMLEY